MTDILVLDLETQHIADEVGGWDHIRDMRLSVGVAYHAQYGVYSTYLEQDAELLVAMLRAAELVVGYNVVRFDYEVLRRYTDDPLDDLPTVDMLLDIQKTLGFRLKLESIAQATLGAGKSASGLQAVRWFRDGRVAEVIDYCRRDVEVTWQVYDFGCKNGYVEYVNNRTWRKERVKVKW